MLIEFQGENTQKRVTLLLRLLPLATAAGT